MKNQQVIQDMKLIVLRVMCGILVTVMLTLAINASSPAPVVDNAAPLSMTGKITVPKISTNLCIESQVNLTDWPIDKAIEQWNKNYKNKFVYSSKCDGYVTIDIKPIPAIWGQTSFPYYRIVGITLIPTVSVDNRLHVLCHELGHVLGLSHNNDQSCMNINQTYSKPSAQDLDTVNDSLWDWFFTRKQAELH